MFNIDTTKFLQLLASRNLSQRQFCIQSGLNAQTVGKLTQGGHKFTIRVIGVISKFFDVPFESIVIRKGA